LTCFGCLLITCCIVFVVDAIQRLPGRSRAELNEAAKTQLGSLTPGQIKNLLSKRREDPVKWTTERISEAFKVERGSLETFLRHYNSLLIVSDQQGKLMAFWELPEHMKHAQVLKGGHQMEELQKEVIAGKNQRVG